MCWEVGGCAAALLIAWLGWVSAVHVMVEIGSRAPQEIEVR